MTSLVKLLWGLLSLRICLISAAGWAAAWLARAVTARTSAPGRPCRSMYGRPVCILIEQASSQPSRSPSSSRDSKTNSDPAGCMPGRAVRLAMPRAMIETFRIFNFPGPICQLVMSGTHDNYSTRSERGMTVALSIGSVFSNPIIRTEESTEDAGDVLVRQSMRHSFGNGVRQRCRRRAVKVGPVVRRMSATASADRTLKDNSSSKYCRCRPEIKSTQSKVMIHGRTATCGY